MDYSTIAVSRLAGQFENSPKLKALISQVVAPLANAEADANELKSERWIDTAIGAQLDGCGNIVGELRQGRSDDEYRSAIKFRVFVNVSQGRASDLIKALSYLTSPTDAQYLETYPATTLLFTNGLFVKSSIQAAMQDLAPAGISTIPVAVSYAAKPFRFAREHIPGELFVNDQYLTADGSDLQVSHGAVTVGNSTLGGCVPSELDVGIGYLDLGGPTLAVYDPNTTEALGQYHLTGVFQ